MPELPTDLMNFVLESEPGVFLHQWKLESRHMTLAVGAIIKFNSINQKSESERKSCNRKQGRRGRPVSFNRRDSARDLQVPFNTPDSKMRSSPSRRKREAKNNILWRFFLEALESGAYYVQWVNKEDGTFKIVDTKECSKQWGRKKNKNNMNFEKLSRGIRYYYKHGLMSRIDTLVYRIHWVCVPCAFRTC